MQQPPIEKKKTWYLRFIFIEKTKSLALGSREEGDFC